MSAIEFYIVLLWKVRFIFWEGFWLISIAPPLEAWVVSMEVLFRVKLH